MALLSSRRLDFTGPLAVSYLFVFSGTSYAACVWPRGAGGAENCESLIM